MCNRQYPRYQAIGKRQYQKEWLVLHAIDNTKGNGHLAPGNRQYAVAMTKTKAIAKAMQGNSKGIAKQR